MSPASLKPAGVGERGAVELVKGVFRAWSLPIGQSMQSGWLLAWPWRRCNKSSSTGTDWLTGGGGVCVLDPPCFAMRRV